MFHYLKPKIIYLTLMMYAAFVTQAFAQSPQRYTQLHVYPETHAVQAGDSLDVVIEQIIAPHWHTYWKNPGDSGAAPVFKWTLPTGWTISDIQYPAPEKIEYGPLLNYGYSDRALLLQTLNVPDDYDGSTVELTADLEVLVCKDICIPEYDVLTITLNGNDMPSNSDLVAEARSGLPTLTSIDATYHQQDKDLYVTLTLPADLHKQKISTAYIIPEEWGAVTNAASVVFEQNDDVVTIIQARGEQSLDDFTDLKTLFYVTTKDGQEHVFDVLAAPHDAMLAQGNGDDRDLTQTPTTGQGFGANVILTLIFAFVGGLILNLMPCVFPILSMKTLSLVKMAQHHPEAAHQHGLAYTAGVVLSFVAIAGALIVLQLGGAQVGWGFQLQNPLIVAGLIYVLFIVGLNLAGLFEIGHGLGNVGSGLATKKGTAGAFFTGILATIVATPCTAPFMATAVGVALTQPPAINLLIFAVLGLGLAFPYLLLAYVPSLQQALPKPGAWMKTFQQFLSFPMFLAVAWLLWVLAQQVGDAKLFSVLLGLVAIVFGIWIFPKAGWFGRVIAVLSFLSALYGMPAIAKKMDDGACYYEQSKNLKMGEEFSLPTLDYYLNQTDKPVIVEMTAAWCITCKLNHASSIDIDSTRDLFYRNDVAFLVGDWTNQDAEITAYLHSFGRNGVPLYVFYPAPIEDGVRPDPVIMPQLLTPSIVERIVEADYMMQ